MTRIDRSSRELASTMTSSYVTGLEGNVEAGAYRWKRAILHVFPCTLTHRVDAAGGEIKAIREHSIRQNYATRLFPPGRYNENIIRIDERMEIPVPFLGKL